MASRRYQSAAESVGADVASLPIDFARRIESSGDDAPGREGNDKMATMMEAKTMEFLYAAPDHSSPMIRERRTSVLTDTPDRANPHAFTTRTDRHLSD
jgi:hypothetical protein